MPTSAGHARRGHARNICGIRRARSKARSAITTFPHPSGDQWRPHSEAATRRKGGGYLGVEFAGGRWRLVGSWIESMRAMTLSMGTSLGAVASIATPSTTTNTSWVLVPNSTWVHPGAGESWVTVRRMREKGERDDGKRCDAVWDAVHRRAASEVQALGLEGSYSEARSRPRPPGPVGTRRAETSGRPPAPMCRRSITQSDHMGLRGRSRVLTHQA